MAATAAACVFGMLRRTPYDGCVGLPKPGAIARRPRRGMLQRCDRRTAPLLRRGKRHPASRALACSVPAVSDERRHHRLAGRPNDALAWRAAAPDLNVPKLPPDSKGCRANICDLGTTAASTVGAGRSAYLSEYAKWFLTVACWRRCHDKPIWTTASAGGFAAITPDTSPASCAAAACRTSTSPTVAVDEPRFAGASARGRTSPRMLSPMICGKEGSKFMLLFACAHDAAGRAPLAGYGVTNVAEVAAEGHALLDRQRERAWRPRGPAALRWWRPGEGRLRAPRHHLHSGASRPLALRWKAPLLSRPKCPAMGPAHPAALERPRRLAKQQGGNPAWAITVLRSTSAEGKSLATLLR